MTGKCGGGNSLRWKFKGSGGGSIPMGGECVAVGIVCDVNFRGVAGGVFLWEANVWRWE